MKDVDSLKYGIVSFFGWNTFLVLLYSGTSLVTGKSVWASMFEDKTNGIIMCLFFMIWSLIWFGIGYTSRKKYKMEKKYFRETAPDLSDDQFNKVFRSHYISKNAKMLSILFITAVPWYILGYVHPNFELKDWIIIILLTIMSIVSFWIYKIKQPHA